MRINRRRRSFTTRHLKRKWWIGTKAAYSEVSRRGFDAERSGRRKKRATTSRSRQSRGQQTRRPLEVSGLRSFSDCRTLPRYCLWLVVCQRLATHQVMLFADVGGTFVQTLSSMASAVASGFLFADSAFALVGKANEPTRCSSSTTTKLPSFVKPYRMLISLLATGSEIVEEPNLLEGSQQLSP